MEHAPPETIAARYARAMQAGQAAEEELIALFAPDAVYVEPFSGEITPCST